MTKKLLLTLVLTFSIMTLTACGSDTTKATTEDLGEALIAFTEKFAEDFSSPELLIALQANEEAATLFTAEAAVMTAWATLDIEAMSDEERGEILDQLNESEEAFEKILEMIK